MSLTSMSTAALSPASERANISAKMSGAIRTLTEKEDTPSNEVAGVSRDSKPHNVPPPRLVPLTRSNVPSSSTLMMETPDPILTSRHGNWGVGFPSNVTANFAGFGFGRSRDAGDGDGCATD